MKKKLPVIIALVLTVLAAVLYGNTTKANRIYDNNVNSISYSDLGVLENGQVITQEFTSAEDVINGLKIKSSVCGNYTGVIVHIELSDADTGELLASMDEQGSNIKARQIHYYKFADALTGMKDRQLIVSITEEGSVSGSGINMYYAPDEEAQYKINVNGAEINGVLPLATATDRFDVETFIIFLLSLWFIWGFMWFLYKLFQ